MFEQSLLLDHAPAKKTGALAASITVQTLAVGVMIAIPLIYSDRLPILHPHISIDFMPPPPPPAPISERPADSAPSLRPTSGPRKTFAVPTRIVSLSEIPTIDTVEAPVFSASDPAIGVIGSIGATSIGSQIFGEILPKPKPPAAPAQALPSKPIVVGGGVQSARLLKKVMPVYPALARQARVSGTVRLIGIIAKDGTIQQLQVTSGHPLLVQSALDAVRQWIYRPTLLNGQAVEVIAPIDVNFTLSQ